MFTRTHLVGLALTVACGGAPAEPAQPRPTPTPPADAVPSEAAFRVAIEKIYWRRLDAHPTDAVSLGFHTQDGKLPDLGANELKERLEQVQQDLKTLSGFEALDGVAATERAALRAALEAERFDLEVLRKPWRNPMTYLGPLELTPYLAREYAPVDERVEAVSRVAAGAPRLLSEGRRNLEAALPRTFVETALLQTRGMLTFVDGDVASFVAGATDAKLRSRAQKALASLQAALREYEAFLSEKLPQSTDAYALGADAFRAMLAATQGIDLDLETLRAAGERDLVRNLEALEAACKEIDANAGTAEVLARIDGDRLSADQLLAEASAQTTRMRRFVEENAIVSIVRDDPVSVTPTPPFMRWNLAFLDGAGPFEKPDESGNPLPSFYYVSPPDPSWPIEQQRSYVPTRSDLLFVSIHEVWPGHFLHALHLRNNPSAVLKTFWNYATGEGWAHYTEQMMWEAGVSKDPVDRVGQIRNALLRNVRYLSAIGLHTGTMTVEQSEAMFRDKAFQDPATARQQAVRGTFDPMYLAYTLGKLVILKLREDVRAKAEAAGEAFDLRRFHDEFLRHGAAPLPAIRTSMLGPDAGPVL